MKIAHELAARWKADPGSLAEYSPQDQRYLHDYYRPSETLSDEQLLEHRREITKDQPSLPQCAGRALNHVYVPEIALYSTARRSYGITVREVIQPIPGYTQLAHALMFMTIDTNIDSSANTNSTGVA